YAYQAAGIDIPRTSSQIANGGRWISQSQAQPGDIVAWPGHVAIYAGNGKIIDASGSKQRVVERSIWGNPTGFVTYRRSTAITDPSGPAPSSGSRAAVVAGPFLQGGRSCPSPPRRRGSVPPSRMGAARRRAPSTRGPSPGVRGR